MAFNWNDEALVRLRELYESGDSMSKIAAALGGASLTRNAVIGKLHRLKLFRGKPVAMPNSVRARRKARATLPQAQRLIGRPPKKTMEPRPMPPESIEDQLIPQDQRLTLLDLENHHCRWPVGEPGAADFFFCGAPTADLDHGRPYCAGHAHIAFNGKPQRGAPFVPRWAA